MLFTPPLGDFSFVNINTETIITALVTAAGTGLCTTILTVRVALARQEEREQEHRLAMEERFKSIERRLTEVLEDFSEVVSELRSPINRLTETVAQHSVHVSGINEVFTRLRTLESAVAVLEARK